MKTSILTILFAATFLTNTISAQPYKSLFGQHSTEWVFQYYNLPGLFNDTMRVVKDSVIDNKTFKILESINFRLAIREDLDSGKVWGVPLLGSECGERLAIDFSLQVGDTFWGDYYPFDYNPDSARVIDSIKYIDGLKYLYTHHPYFGDNEPITFIEGIGSNMGMIIKICDQGSTILNPYLLCSYKDGQQTMYHNRYYDGKCRTLTNVNDLAEQSKNITLYPQPAKGNLYIRNSTNSKITKLEIINSLGQSMRKHVLPTTPSIDIHGIPPGYYFVTLELHSGHTVTKPVLIK